MIHISKSIDLYVEKSEYASKLIIGYLAFQVLVVIASSQISSVEVSVIQWLGNFVGQCIFVFLLLINQHNIGRDVFLLALTNFSAQIIPVVFYGDHLLDSLKSIGLNINIVATLLYFLAWGGMKKIHLPREASDNILRYFLYASAAIAVLTLVLDGNKLIYLFTSINAYKIDFSGVFPNKNMLGSFLALGLMAGIYLLHLCRKKSLLLFLCAIVGFALVCTLSRAAILTIAVFLVVFLMRRAHANKYSGENEFLKKHGKRIRYLVLLASLLCVVLYLENDLIQQFVITKIIRSTAGTAGRDVIWQNIVSSFDDNAIFHLFGMGYSELNFRSAEDCHNIFLYIYATGGLVKAGVYAILLGKAFIDISKLKKENVILADFCFSAAIAYLALGMFETNLLLELGLVNFGYALYILFIPAMSNTTETNGSIIRCR